MIELNLQQQRDYILACQFIDTIEDEEFMRLYTLSLAKDTLELEHDMLFNSDTPLHLQFKLQTRKNYINTIDSLEELKNITKMMSKYYYSLVK